MNFIKRLATLVYVTSGMFLGTFIILYATNRLDYLSVTRFFHFIYFDDNLQIVFMLLGIIVLLQNYMIYKYYSVNVHRDKIIAFDNPSGRVTVSLFAMEDLVKRVIYQLPEIKDAKATIMATKKGLRIKTRLSLRSEVNIPEITSKVQGIVKKKIQDIIGLDEPINIAIFIGKIVLEKSKEKSKEKKKDVILDDDSSEPTVPFHGYRA